MLTRYEEGISPERDAYDRFPMAASLAAREGFAMQPLADAYVELLWAAIVSQWPRLERRQHAYRLRLTHDVDFARASDDRSPKHLVRAVAGDVARRRDVDLARRRVSAFVERRRDPATLRTTDTIRYLCGSDVGQREAWHREHVLRDGQRRARIDRRQLRRVVAVDGRATHGESIDVAIRSAYTGASKHTLTARHSGGRWIASSE